MKYITKNIIFTLILFFAIISCDDPNPTELINDKDEVEIDVINPEPNSIVITGYDSTGITKATPKKQSVISLSGIKTTYVKGKTFYRGYGEAVFFDTSKAVFINKDRLIGYKTLKFGKIKVGNDTARIVPYFLKYRENFVVKDTLVGVKHIISYKRELIPRNQIPYDKNIKISFRKLQGSPTQFIVKLPEEIIGKINVSGSRVKDNLSIDMSWNKSSTGEDEIIVGGILSGRRELIPLFRMKKFRENKFLIPNSFIKTILADNYSSIVVSFIRKNRKTIPTSRLGDIYIASQSIHNIWIAL